MILLLTMPLTTSFPSVAADPVIKCKTDSYGFNRCSSRVKKGDISPFSGVVLDNNSIGHIQSGKIKKARLCEEDKKFIEKMCKIDDDAASQRLDVLSDAKQKEIAILQGALKKERKLLEKAIDKKKPFNFFESPELWISVGFIGGVVIGAGFAYGGAWAWSTVNNSSRWMEG